MWVAGFHLLSKAMQVLVFWLQSLRKNQMLIVGDVLFVVVVGGEDQNFVEEFGVVNEEPFGALIGRGGKVLWVLFGVGDGSIGILKQGLGQQALEVGADNSVLAFLLITAGCKSWVEVR
ncbi:hypothetical protein L7F22_035413 [Adiantum nelumboides]|nr:hypothetical protein [Adiantum nelumboides]